MSCFAIATAQALVDLDSQVAKYLTTQEVQIVLLAQLQAMGHKANWLPTQDPNTVVMQTNRFSVTYQAGKIKVTGQPYALMSQADIDRIAQELGQVLSQAAGLVFQNLVAQALGQIGFVESVDMANNGAMVVTLEV